MKKLKVLVTVPFIINLFFANHDCFGQNDTLTTKTQVYLGINYGTNSIHVLDNIAGIFASQVSNQFSDITEHRKMSSATMFVEGGFSRGQKVFLSLALGMERFHGEVVDNGTNETIGSFYDEYLTAAVEATKIYGRNSTINSKFYVYGVLGMGYVNRTRHIEGIAPAFLNDRYLKDHKLGWYIAPVGFSYGGRLRVNVELGFGYRGGYSCTLQYTI